jgi:hypothetical protein
MPVRLSVLSTGRALLARNIIFLLLVLISVRGRVDSWLIDGDKVVGLTYRQLSIPQKYHFYVSGTHFC